MKGMSGFLFSKVGKKKKKKSFSICVVPLQLCAADSGRCIHQRIHDIKLVAGRSNLYKNIHLLCGICDFIMSFRKSQKFSKSFCLY